MSEHVDSQQPGPSNEALMKTDWNKCLLCLEVTSEVLRCPAESKCFDVGAGKGYSTLSLNITRFSELNELPMPIDLRPLSAMVVVILNDPNFNSQGCDGVSQASISIAQLLQYHISVRQRLGSTGISSEYKRNTIANLCGTCGSC